MTRRILPAFALAAGLALSASAWPAMAQDNHDLSIHLATPRDTIQTQLVSDGNTFVQRVSLESDSHEVRVPIDLTTARAEDLAPGSAVSIEVRDIRGPGELLVDGPSYLFPGQTADLTFSASAPGRYLATVRLAATTDEGNQYYSDLDLAFQLGSSPASPGRDSRLAGSTSDEGFDWVAWATEDPVTLARDIDAFRTEITRLDREYAKIEPYLEKYFAKDSDTNRGQRTATQQRSGTVVQPSQQRSPDQEAAPLPTVAGTSQASTAGRTGGSASSGSGSGSGSGTSSGSASTGGSSSGGGSGSTGGTGSTGASTSDTTADEAAVTEETNETLDTPQWLLAEPDQNNRQSLQHEASSPDAPAQTSSSTTLWQGVALGAGAMALLVGLLRLAMSFGELRAIRRANDNL